VIFSENQLHFETINIRAHVIGSALSFKVYRF